MKQLNLTGSSSEADDFIRLTYEVTVWGYI